MNKYRTHNCSELSETEIKYLILASVVANQANSKLLNDAISAPINKVIIVPNFIAKYPPINPPAIVAKTPKNLEYVAISPML